MAIGNRYRATRLLGDGTFGRVLLADDLNDSKAARRTVAIKVIRDVKRYTQNAKIEADILKDIQDWDPGGRASRSVIMHDTFMHNGHFCLVLEPAGRSLYDVLEKNDFQGFWMMDIQTIARQGLEGLTFLHSRLRMAHTDLKPENILLQSTEPLRPSDFPREDTYSRDRRSDSRDHTPYFRPQSARIKFIDFGNATYRDEHHPAIISTRQYRGPEVLLALGWDEGADIWSFGCILMELYTGDPLFSARSNLEHLVLIERTLGHLPRAMLYGTSNSIKDKYFQSSAPSGDLKLLDPGSDSHRRVRRQRAIRDVVFQRHDVLAAFVGGLLTLDRNERPSAASILRHSIFLKEFDD